MLATLLVLMTSIVLILLMVPSVTAQYAWTQPINTRSIVSAVSIDGATIYTQGSANTSTASMSLTALDATTGGIKWSVDTDSGVCNTILAGKDAVYYVGAFTIFSFSFQGALRWQYNAGFEINQAFLLESKNTLVAREMYSDVIALDTVNGSLLPWTPKISTQHQIVADRAERGIYYVSACTVYAISTANIANGTNGIVLWKTELPLYPANTECGSMYTDGKFLFVTVTGNTGSRLTAIDSTNGAVVWNNDGIFYIIAIGGSLLFTQGVSNFSAIQVSTGDFLWRRTAPNTVGYVAALAAEDVDLLFISGDYNSGGVVFAALDVSSGSTVWNFTQFPAIVGEATISAPLFSPLASLVAVSYGSNDEERVMYAFTAPGNPTPPPTPAPQQSVELEYESVVCSGSAHELISNTGCETAPDGSWVLRECVNGDLLVQTFPQANCTGIPMTSNTFLLGRCYFSTLTGRAVSLVSCY